jgi:hypothetical protein
MGSTHIVGLATQHEALKSRYGVAYFGSFLKVLAKDLPLFRFRGLFLRLIGDVSTHQPWSADIL